MDAGGGPPLTFVGKTGSLVWVGVSSGGLGRSFSSCIRGRPFNSILNLLDFYIEMTMIK